MYFKSIWTGLIKTIRTLNGLLVEISLQSLFLNISILKENAKF